MFASQNRISRQITHLVRTHINSNADIRPHFFLTGPSGSGKSFLTKRICEEMQVPYFEVNAAQLTAEGLSGNSLSKAMRPLTKHWDKPNVVFIDEFDKLFSRGGQTTEGFRSDVQDEFLHMLEAKNVSIFTDYGKYEPFKVENTLFIFAGAFQGQNIRDLQGLRDAGMRTEFVGRVPLVFSTEAVSMDELLKALPNTKLLRDYLSLHPEITKSRACNSIEKLIRIQQKQCDLGIRLLTSCTHQFFMGDLK